MLSRVSSLTLKMIFKKKTVIIKLLLVSIVYPGNLMFNGAKIARAIFDIPKMVYQEWWLMYIRDVNPSSLYIDFVYIYREFCEKGLGFFQFSILAIFINTLPSLYMVQGIFGICNTNWFLGCTPVTSLFSTSTSISISLHQSPCMITEISSYFLDEYR